MGSRARLRPWGRCWRRGWVAGSPCCAFRARCVWTVAAGCFERLPAISPAPRLCSGAGAWRRGAGGTPARVSVVLLGSRATEPAAAGLKSCRARC